MTSAAVRSDWLIEQLWDWSIERTVQSVSWAVLFVFRFCCVVAFPDVMASEGGVVVKMLHTHTHTHTHTVSLSLSLSLSLSVYLSLSLAHTHTLVDQELWAKIIAKCSGQFRSV